MQFSLATRVRYFRVITCVGHVCPSIMVSGADLQADWLWRPAATSMDSLMCGAWPHRVGCFVYDLVLAKAPHWMNQSWSHSVGLWWKLHGLLDVSDLEPLEKGSGAGQGRLPLVLGLRQLGRSCDAGWGWQPLVLVLGLLGRSCGVSWGRLPFLLGLEPFGGSCSVS